LAKIFEAAVGHEVRLYPYGENTIKDGKVAVVAGGGFSEEIESAYKMGVNVFLTGITAHTDYSHNAHEFAMANRINVLGGTHYSTETFACIKMVEYFKNLGLPCEFIADEPVMEDL
jgi:putative NIF3 family GTP cyclohydrolase 1 type 2